MLVIHHIEGRRSERVAWLCEELDIPYRLEFVSGDVLASFKAIKAVHPMSMAPTLEDGALKLVESGAILEYLLSRYGKGRLRPVESSDDFPRYLQWLHFAEGSGMFRAMAEQIVIRASAGTPSPYIAWCIGGSARVLGFAEAELTCSPYFAGEQFSAADIMMHFPLRLAAVAATGNPSVTPIFHDDHSGLVDYPAVNAFLDRMAARPAFQRAMANCLPSGAPPF